MNGEPILILANPEGKAYGLAKNIYEKLNSNPNRERKYEFGDVELPKFKDGELYTKIKPNVRKRTCFFI